ACVVLLRLCRETGSGGNSVPAEEQADWDHRFFFLFPVPKRSPVPNCKTIIISGWSSGAKGRWLAARFKFFNHNGHEGARGKSDSCFPVRCGRTKTFAEGRSQLV